MNDLSQRLRDGVPTPPDLTDVAARSAAAGRRRRTQRRLAGVVAVVVLAAGGVALPRMLADGPPDPAERSEPPCVASPDAPLAQITTQEATWIRFCQPADERATRQARFSRGAITGQLARSVVEGFAYMVDSECGSETPPVPSRLFRAQIGLADGSVAQVAGDTACADDHLFFIQLETVLRGTGGTRDPGARVEPRAVTCPDGLTTTGTNRDGADAGLLREEPGSAALATVPLIPGQVSAIDVCAYTGQGDNRTFVEQWRSQSVANILAAATTGYRDGMADCEPRPGATSYVVVLQDFTGTARTFTLDAAACGAMSAAIGTPPEETYLGLATPELVRLVRDSRTP